MVCPAPGVDVDALKKTVSLTPGDCGENVKSGFGNAAGRAAPTGINADADADSPRSLVTVSVTVKLATVPYVWAIVFPVPLVPSPKSQAYVTIWLAPAPIVLGDASKWRARPAVAGVGVTVKAAV